MTCASKCQAEVAPTGVARTKVPTSNGESALNALRNGKHITLIFTREKTRKKNVCKNTIRNRRGGSPPLGVSGSKSKETCSVVQRTDALTQGLDLILEHHNAKDLIRAALRKQCHDYLDNSPDESVWLKRCKYLLSYPLAKFLKNPLPPKPDVEFRPTGALRGWMKDRLNAFNPRNVHLWYSWFQAKRSTLPLSDAIIAQTYEKHLDTLTSPDPGDDVVIQKIFDNPCFLYVLNKLKSKINKSFGVRTQTESIGDARLNFNYYTKLFQKFENEMPKTSACFETTRQFGGQATALREACGLYQTHYRPVRKAHVLGEVISPEFHSMVYRPWVYTSDGTKNNFVQTRYCAYGYSEWQNLPRILCQNELRSPLCCTIQAVLEPNKVRVISKGEALPYYSCKPLQLLLHKKMKKMPCFNLIGRPLLESDIARIATHVNENVDWEPGWASVDYSAATDGLSYKYSGEIQRYLFSDIPPEYGNIAEMVLGPHRLFYPKSGKREIEERGTQTNGQLMGSILSFPTLCLANLGVYLQSFYETNPYADPGVRQYSYQQILNTVLINGDDMVYAGVKDTYDRNIEIGRKVGLEMSIGKAYFHREYLNINSQSVLYPLHKPLNNRSIKFVNFLNTGLFFGLHKVQKKSGIGEKPETALDVAAAHVKEKEGIVPNLNCLLEGSLPGRHHHLLMKSLKTHKETLRKECSARTHRGKPFTRNLFVSEKLGGMGVKAPEGFKFFISKTDQAIAHGCLKKFNYNYSLVRPVPGPEPEESTNWSDEPWQPRVTGDELDRPSYPYHKITFKGLKKILRSPVFEFYVPYNGCLTTRGTEGNRKVRSALVLRPDEDFDPFMEFERIEEELGLKRQKSQKNPDSVIQKAKSLLLKFCDTPIPLTGIRPVIIKKAKTFLSDPKKHFLRTRKGPRSANRDKANASSRRK